MVRRFLCLGILVFTLLGVSACGPGDTKPSPRPSSKVPDPEGNAVPKPGGSKAG